MTTVSSSAAFERFFEACAVPTEMVPKYAARFVKERIHPQLMKELGKDDLRELGIAALGDQLSIMRYIKQCDGNPPEFSSASTQKALRRNVPDPDSEEEEEEEPMIVDSGSSNFKAPDRHEIYHIKMPAGNIPKTRKILETHKVLREKGVIKRGVSGVRRAGVELKKHPLNITSARSKVIARKPAPMTVKIQQDTDISSSSAAGFLHMGSMRSDAISRKTTIVSESDSPPRETPRNMSLTKRFESIGGGTNVLRVQLASAGGRTIKPLPPQKRKLIHYGDDYFYDSIEVDEPRMEVQPNKRMSMRAPIAERVQVVGVVGAPAATAQSKRRRPIITIEGKNVKSGVARARAKAPMLEQRTSILDRITVAR